MSRRSILSAAERSSLLVVPDCVSEFERWYSFTEADLSFVGLRRGDANRLGVAVQLCLLRFPGQAFSAEVGMPDALVGWVARQLKVDVCCWVDYAERDAHLRAPRRSNPRRQEP